MTDQPGLAGQPMLPPSSPSSGGRAVKIVALVVIGLVVVCGIAGSCLFALTLVAPLIIGTPTPLQ